MAGPLNGYHSRMHRRGPLCSAILAAALLAGHPAAFPAPASSPTVLTRAYELSYALDRDEALALLRRAVADQPSEPALHRALASVLWLDMLFQRGAITVDHYLGSFSRTQVELRQPPAQLDAEFRAHVARATALAEARLAAAPGDAQARYDLGAAIALEASHVATVQGRMFAGIKAARRAFDEHEKVLALDPRRHDAGLVVGTYRYVISTLPAPMRVMAYAVGFGGGRERGIAMVEEAARHPGESRTDAMFALVLLYNRERRYDDALRVLGELRKMYPRNRLVLLEAGSTALRAGRATQAEALLSEGLAAVAREARPLMPGERALWHLKRGASRLSLGRVDEARADLEVARGAEAQEWVRGRAHAELARMALRGGQRPQARELAAAAEALCRRGSDPPCVGDARQLMRSARGR